jgi:cytochrome c oxidase assembly factor 7
VGRLLARDCELHGKPFECHALAEFTQGVLRDYAAAQAWYEKLCHGAAYGPSCFNLAALHMSGRAAGPASPDSALALFTRACELGKPEGCNNAGLLRQRGTAASPRDPAAAAALFAQGCDGGYHNACFNLSIHHMQAPPAARDMDRALLYAVRACRLGHSWGCANASRILATGDGVPADPERAAELRRIAVDLERAAKGAAP